MVPRETGNNAHAKFGGTKSIMVLANTKNTIILFVSSSKVLHKHCFYFLFGLIMVENGPLPLYYIRRSLSAFSQIQNCK